MQRFSGETEKANFYRLLTMVARGINTVVEICF